MKRLREFDRVDIDLPTGQTRPRDRELEATVIAFDGSTATLESIGPLPEGLPARLPHVLLSFEHERRLVGLKGVLTYDNRRLHFTVEDGVELPRRTSTRIRLETAVQLTRPGESTGVAGVTVDIGAGGLLVAVPMEVAAGERVEVSAELPAPVGHLALSARVVRNNDGLIALELLHTGSGIRPKLSELIADHQSALLRRTHPWHAPRS
jgi:hypothetical protein